MCHHLALRLKFDPLANQPIINPQSKLYLYILSLFDSLESGVKTLWARLRISRFRLGFGIADVVSMFGQVHW